MMVEDMKFSVAMSVYKNDNPIFFAAALESIVENQTIMPSEIVLVVDGPVSEELNNVINSFDNRFDIFKIVRLKENQGLGNALKVAVENCQYELIARMDSDDISLSSRFEEQLSFFATNERIDIVGGDIAEFIGNESNIVGKRVVPQTDSDIREYMKTRCAMNHVTVMFKKTAVQAAGGYLDWYWNEDYYLWIRMWLNGAVFANTGTTLVNVRVGEDMYSRRGGKKYYESEVKLQKYMMDNKMITHPLYMLNCSKRFVVQKMLPNRLRGWVFRVFARSK